MMKSLTAAQQRFFDNAVLLAALQLIFDSLEKFGVPMYPLGEVANTTSGGTPDRGISDYYGGNIPWIKSGELRDGPIKESEEYITDAGLQNSSAKVFPKGTLVVALYGATVGKTGILAINAASNQAVCAITPNNRVSTFFLFWFLRYKRPDFLKGSFGAAQPNISQKVLRETLIPVPTTDLQKEICNFLEIVEERQRGKKDFLLPHLPSPLSNLRDIVARIEELAARIEEARGLRREAVGEAEALFSSALESLFEGNNATNWQYEKLAGNGLATVVAGQHIMAEEYNLSGYGIPYLTGPADFGARVAEIKRWTLTPKSTALPGDILLTVKGAGVGKINLAPDVEVAMGRQLMAIRPNPRRVLREFVYFFLEHKFEHFRSIATATTVPGFKKADVEELLIPVPDLTEQHDIVSYLDDLQSKVDSLTQFQSETSAELDALLPSILDKAFKGEL